MNASVAPLGVGIETSVAVSARAVMGMPAESIVSKKAMRRERAKVDVPYHGSSDTLRFGLSLKRQRYIGPMSDLIGIEPASLRRYQPANECRIWGHSRRFRNATDESRLVAISDIRRQRFESEASFG